MIIHLICLCLFSLVFKLIYGYENVTEIKAIAYTYYEEKQIYSPLIEEFNNYAKSNNLNITINLNLFSQENSTRADDYGSVIESVLQKRKNSNNIYDIIFYDNIYTARYEPYLLDLRELLDESLIEIYDSRVLDQTCTSKNRLVGLPISLDYTFLYSNAVLLEKYDKSIPKAWNQLYETGKYILEEERKKNNTDLIGFSTLFSG